jgi:hypothetical protein
LPTLAIVTVVALGFVYFSQVIAYTLAGTVILAGTVYAVRALPPAVFNGLILFEHWRQERIVTNRARIAQYIHETKAGVLVVRSENRTISIDSFYPAVSASKELADAPLLLPASTQPVDLLATLDRVQRGLIVGASDTGKTTVLQWLVSRSRSHVVVIDPHAYPGKYPGNCRVIGQGRNYGEIDRALAALVQLMTRRYDEIGRGAVAEMAHRRVTVLIDEWRAITGNLGKPASAAIKTLLTESRKAAFSVFVASHSDRAEPLGLKGEYDLKDGFVIVKLSIVDGQRQATVDFGSGEVPAILPGPFVVSLPALRPREPLDLTPADPELTEQEQRIVELKAEGLSNRAICQEVFGYVSSNKYSEIDAAVQRANRANRAK